MAIQMKDIVDERLNKIINTINNLGSYYKTNYLLNLKTPLAECEPMDMIYAKDYIDYIGTLSLANDLIAELSVYSLSNDEVFTSKGVKTLNDWHKDTFKKNSSNALEQWRQLLINNTPGRIYPEQLYYTNSVPVRVLPLIQKLPLGSKKHNIGNVCVLINCKKLFTGFLDSNSYKNYYITNQNSELLYSYRDIDLADYPIEIPENKNAGSLIKKINQENQIITYARSNEGLVFVTVTPYKEVMSQAYYLKNIFYFMIAFSFAACLSAAAVILIKINKPVKSLLDDNHDLNSRIKEQTKQVQVSIFCRLLTGFYSSKQEIKLSLGLVGIDSSNKLYNVVNIVMQNDSQQELTDYIGIKARIIEFTADNHIYAVDTGLDCLSLIFEFSESNIDRCKEKIISVIEEIQSHLSLHHISVLAGCGCFYEDITQIRDSYSEAVFSFKSRISQGNNLVFWYNDQNLIPMFFYPLEIEQRILISTRCGDYAAIKESLELIYAENYLKTKIPDNMSDLLVMKIKTTLLSACSEIQALNGVLYQDTISFIFSSEGNNPKEQTYNKIKETFEAICRITSMSQTIRSNQLKQNILEFIDSHYHENDMCLSLVADTFHISEAYLSAFFKEQTGINFISYIETKRLTKACILLKEHSLSIDSIAESVGYTSAHSFRRAFKRNFGINPANYSS